LRPWVRLLGGGAQRLVAAQVDPGNARTLDPERAHAVPGARQVRGEVLELAGKVLVDEEDVHRLRRALGAAAGTAPGRTKRTAPPTVPRCFSSRTILPRQSKCAGPHGVARSIAKRTRLPILYDTSVSKNAPEALTSRVTPFARPRSTARRARTRFSLR